MILRKRLGTRAGFDVAFIVATAAAVAAGQAPSPGMLRAFRSECATRAKVAAQAGRMTEVGKNGWLFFGPELRHLSVGPFWGPFAAKVSRATDSRNADPLPAILDFKRQLDSAKVELLLIPVPPKAIVYPDFLSDSVHFTGTPTRLDPDLQGFYALLRKSGVNVLDVTPEFLANRSGAHGPVFCKQDTHWSGKGCVLAASRIAALVRARSWARALTMRQFTARWESVEISGDLWQDLGPKAPPRESVAVRTVGTKAGGEVSPAETSRSSPILLLGDSHTLVFHAGGDMLATGAGLADQLAYELGFPVDLIGVRGSGATPARISLLRQVRSDPRYLKGKKLIIWCFGAREFTESTGWQKVPVVH